MVIFVVNVCFVREGLRDPISLLSSVRLFVISVINGKNDDDNDEEEENPLPSVTVTDDEDTVVVVVTVVDSDAKPPAVGVVAGLEVLLFVAI